MEKKLKKSIFNSGCWCVIQNIAVGCCVHKEELIQNLIKELGITEEEAQELSTASTFARDEIYNIMGWQVYWSY